MKMLDAIWGLVFGPGLGPMVLTATLKKRSWEKVWRWEYHVILYYGEMMEV
jgi:hypothetical protein